MIKVSNLVKNYDEKNAVNDISFEIKSGEIVGLLGPNGAGKSTTMKMITGYLIPDQGKITIDEMNIKDNPIEVKKLIGYMPENNPLYKDMLVRDAIELSMDLHSIPQEIRAERVDFVVNAVGLKEVYYRPINELSKGYKQRVGLAQVLVNDPKILILDEPTEGLDPNQRAEIRNLIKKIGEDRTVIISTHVMQEVEAMCSRIILLNKGKVVVDGSLEEVLSVKGKNSVVTVKLKGDRVKSKTELSKLGTIAEEKDLNGFLTFTLNVQEDFGSRFSTLVKKGEFELFELIPRRQNLEEIFRELTK